ncbi:MULTISPECIES: hypothetical protein [Providencia]|uniref:hypothetical protein n=1 Tax=Providencia TaxID=586 RepID=UPI0024B11DCD
MMVNHKCISLIEANEILSPILGDNIEIINFIDYAKDHSFLLVKQLKNWEEKDDIDILKEINLHNYQLGELIVLNDFLYINKMAFLLDAKDIDCFLDEYFKKYSICLIDGDTYFFSISKKELLLFNHDGYFMVYKLPIKLMEKGIDKHIKFKDKL